MNSASLLSPSLRKALLALLAAPLALGLAACSGSDDADAGLSGDPIETVAPPEGVASWSEVVATTPEGGYRMGNPDAPIKLIEFASLTCPHCATFAQTSKEELQGNFVNSGRVSLEFRNFILNPLDLAMTMMTRCGAPESFMALTEQAFLGQQELIETWSAASEGFHRICGHCRPAGFFRRAGHGGG